MHAGECTLAGTRENQQRWMALFLSGRPLRNSEITKHTLAKSVTSLYLFASGPGNTHTHSQHTHARTKGRGENIDSAGQKAGSHRLRQESVDHVSLFDYKNEALSKTKEIVASPYRLT